MMRFLAVLLALAVPPVIYFTTLGPQRKQRLNRAESEIAELDKRVAMGRSAERKLPQFREEVVRLDGEIEKLRRILPTEMDIEGIRAISKVAAEKNGVKLTRFETKAGEVVGSAEGAAGFFRDIQNAPRIIDVTSVTMRKDVGGWRSGFVMTAYALPD